MKYLRDYATRIPKKAISGFFTGTYRHITGGPLNGALSNGARDRGVASEGPSIGGGPSGALTDLGSAPDAGGHRDSLEEEHLSFSQAFEEAPISLDEFGSPSHRPALRVDISRSGEPLAASDRSFGKPRFNVKGLRQHEPLHQPSLWQQLLRQEIDRRVQRQAGTARHKAKVLGASAASAASHTRKEQGSLTNAYGGRGLAEAGDLPAFKVHGETVPSRGPLAAPLDGTEQVLCSEGAPDWRNLSTFQQEYEVNAKIMAVEAPSKTPQQSHQGAVVDGQPPASDLSPEDAALHAMGQQLGDEEGLGGGFQVSPLLSAASAGGGIATEAAEVIDAGSPIAVATHKAGMPRGVWERLPPQHLHTQQRLLRARTPEDILAAIGNALETVGGGSIGEEHEDILSASAETVDAAAAAASLAARRRLSVQFGLDPVNAVTAVHRLGKLLTPYQRGVLLEDKRFVALMEAGKAALPLIDSQGVSNMLWGLTRLEHTPEWLPQLLTRCASLSSQMTPHQVATCLYSLSRLPLSLGECRDLQLALVNATAVVTPQLQRPLDLTCICVALARLKAKDPRIFAGLAARARQLLPQLSMSELASVAWAFAAVGLVDKGLFAAVQRRVEADAEMCSPGDIVQLAWSLARTGEEKKDLFDYTFTPVIRGCLPQFNSRQLATIASAYSQAGVQDMELLSDLSVTMLPHLSAFSPQQIATVAVAFAHLGYSNREFMGALAQKTLKHLSNFSALQLTRVIYGLGVGGCTDTRVLDSCCSVLEKKVHALRPDWITQALVGLSEAEYLSHPAVPALLRAVGKTVECLFAEDSVQLLLVLSKVDTAVRPAQLVQQIQQQMQAKLRTHWCLDCDSLCDLMLALLGLRLSDQHLLQMTMRRLAYLLGQASTREFLRLLGCFAALPADERLLIRTHLHRRLKVQGALSAQLEQLSAMTLDADSTAALLFACSQLGFADEAVVKMAEGLQHKLETEEEVLSLTSLCHFLWANTEMNISLGWTRNVLQYMLARRYSNRVAGASVGLPASVFTLDERNAFCEAHGLMRYRGGEVLPQLVGEEGQLHQAASENNPQATAIAESLLRAAFVCVSLGEEEYIMPLMEDVAAHYGSRLPSDLLPAQQVCLHVSRFLGPAAAGKPSAQLRDWMSSVLGAPRYDVYYKGGARNKFGPDSARLRVKDYNFDMWLSEPLIQMKIPHKVTFVVAGIYRVSVAFPLEKHLIDVLTFQDLIAPSSKPTAMAELRQRQLTLLGWTVHSVHLRSLYSAVLDRNLRSFVAQIAAACCPQAAEYVSFCSTKQQRGTEQGSGSGNADLPVSSLLGADLEKLPSLQRGNFKAFELNDDDLRENRPSGRQHLLHRRHSARGACKEFGVEHANNGDEIQEDVRFQEFADILEQQETLEEDARASIAVAEALQNTYSNSGGR